MHHVLVTGSSGAVARPVCAELARRGHHVRGLDVLPTPWLDDAVVGSITDRAFVLQAATGVDTIVHLAAVPDEAPFDELVGPNVFGLFNVMDAARKLGVRRVVLASSIQTIQRAWRRDDLVMTSEATPGNHYALTKVWAESMGEMYARCYGLSVIALRIGWVVRDPEHDLRGRPYRRAHPLYLSYRDCGRCCAQAVEVEGLGYAVVFAVGRDGLNHFDMQPTRELLGFEPEDGWPAGLPHELITPPPDAEAAPA
jgi:nucleoside-diphosphate-sugar epimerase